MYDNYTRIKYNYTKFGFKIVDELRYVKPQSLFIFWLNKLFWIYPVVGKRSIYRFKSRHDQVVYKHQQNVYII